MERIEAGPTSKCACILLHNRELKQRDLMWRSDSVTHGGSISSQLGKKDQGRIGVKLKWSFALMILLRLGHSSRKATCFPTNSFTRFSMATASPSQTVPAETPGEVNDVFRLVQSHNAKAARLPPVEEVRTVLDQSVRGMLSTFSHKYEGYPSGSMVDFACDEDGSAIVAISSLTFHSKDLLANPKCSLLVARDPEDRTDLVITLHGDAVPVHEKDREAAHATYLSKHPNALWVDFGDFQFLRIEPKVVCYVSGVATALLGSGEVLKEEYGMAKVDPIAQFTKPVGLHMNRDHAEDTKLIVKHWTSIPVDSAYMLDVDSLGFSVKATCRGTSFKLRVPFPRPAEDRKDVKTLIVGMLQAANRS